MGAITDEFVEAFRDFVTDGVASSGLHEPTKAEIRALGALIEAGIANAGLGALVDVVYATKAELDADLAHAANSVGLVYGDATDANNDLYVKAGASGAGAWTQTSIMHDVIEVLAQPYAGAAAASAAEADATSDAFTAATQAKRDLNRAVGYTTGESWARYQGGAVTYANGLFTQAANIASAYQDILSVDPANYPNGVTAIIPQVTGTFSSVTFQQYSAASALLSSTVMTKQDVSYVASVAVDPAAVRFRFIHSTSTPLGPVTFARPRIANAPTAIPIFTGRYHGLSNLLNRTADAQLNLFTGISGIFNSVTGAGGPATLAGNQVTIPEGTMVQITIPISGVASGELVSILFELDQDVNKLDTLTGRAETGLGGGTGANYSGRLLGDGIVKITKPFATGNGNPVVRYIVIIQNTNAFPIIARNFKIVRGDHVPSALAAPAYVSDALSAAGVGVVHVAAGGSDANPGTASAPFATLDAAIATGAATIEIPADGNIYPFSGVSLTGRKLTLRTKSAAGQASRLARVFGGVLLTSANFAVAGGYTNLSRVALANSPNAMWERDNATGTLTLMGELQQPNANHRLFPGASASLAAADAAAAGVKAWRHEAGFLYVYGVVAGKTYLVATPDHAVTVNAGAELELGVRLMGGRSGCILATNGRVSIPHGELGWSGGYSINLVNSTLTFGYLGSYYSGSGADNLQNDAGCVVRGHTYFSESPSGDAYSPHANGTKCHIVSFTSLNAGKYGFVPVSVDNEFRIDMLYERNSYLGAILISPGGAAYGSGATAARFGTIDTDTNVKFQNNSVAGAGTMTVSIDRLVGGRLIVEAPAGYEDSANPRYTLVTVREHIYRAPAQDVPAVWVLGGSLEWTGKVSRANQGLLIANGKAKMRGHLLRNLIGISQTGGTLDLDVNDPVNVFGNTTQFSGVSGADQAKTLSIAAV